MADKNYIKALRRAKSKRLFYVNVLLFSLASIFLLILNVSLIAPNVPWSMAFVLGFSIILVIHRLLLFKRPRKTLFSQDYLEYMTEKELRLIELEDEIDEQEAERLDLDGLKLPELRRPYGGHEGELV